MELNHLSSESSNLGTNNYSRYIEPTPILNMRNPIYETKQLFSRKAFISQIKEMEKILFEQQHAIEEGKDEVAYLLDQMKTVLRNKASLYQTISHIRSTLKSKRNKKFAASLTRKEIKTNFQKCDAILCSTIQQNNSIRNTIDTNIHISTALKGEIEILIGQYHQLSARLCSSFNQSSKEKIIELNNRIDSFHLTSKAEYEEKIAYMDSYIKELKQKIKEKKASLIQNKCNQSPQENLKKNIRDLSKSESNPIAKAILQKKSPKKCLPTKRRIPQNVGAGGKTSVCSEKISAGTSIKSKNLTPLRKNRKLKLNKSQRPMKTSKKNEDSTESDFSNELGKLFELDQTEFVNDEFNPYLPDINRLKNNCINPTFDSDDSLSIQEI